MQGPRVSAPGFRLAPVDGLNFGLLSALSTSKHLEKNKKVNNRRLWAREQG